MASPFPPPPPDARTNIADDETRLEQYQADWLLYQRCKLTPDYVEFGDMSYILDMTPPRDLFIQRNMIGHFVYCCNRDLHETRVVEIAES